MSDDIDWDSDAEQEAIRASILKRARVEGIKVAYESALEVCRDKNAPAAAKASSQRTLLAVGGVLDRRDREEAREKPLAEMSSAELERELRKLSSKRPENRGDRAKSTLRESDDGVFK
jgi:hypothetical protein